MIHLRYCIYTNVSVALTADASLVPAKAYVDDLNMKCPTFVRSPSVQEQAILGILHYPLEPSVQVLPRHCRARQYMPFVRTDAVEL